MSVSLQDLGNTLRKAREGRGLSLDRLSAKTGVSRGYLWKLEQGKANPTVGKLRQLGQALALPIPALLEQAGWGGPCPHPPDRLYSWWAEDAKGRSLVVACCQCGEVLHEADFRSNPKGGRT